MDVPTCLHAPHQVTVILSEAKDPRAKRTAPRAGIRRLGGIISPCGPAASPGDPSPGSARGGSPHRLRMTGVCGGADGASEGIIWPSGPAGRHTSRYGPYAIGRRVWGTYGR